jgi:hypothetical protein
LVSKKTVVSETTRRHWGIDVLAAVYAIGMVASIWLFVIGTSTERLIGLILAPFCFIISLGLAFRVNALRIVIVAFLALAVFGDTLLLLYWLGVDFGFMRAPANKDPIRESLRIPPRLVATVTMFLYLRRPSVRAEFRRPGARRLSGDGGESEAGSQDGRERTPPTPELPPQ